MVFIGLIILSLITTAITAGVVHVAWPWFVTPLLGIAPVSFLTVVGVIYIIRVVVHPVTFKDLAPDMDEDDKLKLIVTAAVTDWIRSVIVLGILWLIHIYI